MPVIEYDRPKYLRLKRAYQLAVNSNQESFMFEGNEYVTNYAKYLIEYLESNYFRP